MIKTKQIAADRTFDNTKIVLPVEMARGVYISEAPSLRALKLMHLMIASAGGRMADDVRHELRLSDIRKIDGMNNHTRATLIPLFQELSSIVVVYEDSKDRETVIGGVVDVVRIAWENDEENPDRYSGPIGDILVKWWFRRSFREMADESNHWAILDRQTIFHLGSKYSVLMFQYVASLVNLDHVTSKTFTVTELRAMLGVPERKMERWNDVNRFALKPAIAEINQTSRLTLTATPHKIGRTVASVTIAWEEKPQEGKQEVKRELDRPKVGRAARRDGTAEAPVLAFPASGSIEFDEHWKALKRSAGCNMDNTMIAEKFRAWCAGKSLALDARNIERAFSNFCATVGKV
jgi:hypothetical protein